MRLDEKKQGEVCGAQEYFIGVDVRVEPDGFEVFTGVYFLSWSIHSFPAHARRERGNSTQ